MTYNCLFYVIIDMQIDIQQLFISAGGYDSSSTAVQPVGKEMYWF